VSPEKSILVVDNDVMLLQLVRESLSALLDCQVDSTPSPEYAFELVLRRRYDLLIFDLKMPELDGVMLHTLLSKVFALRRSDDSVLPPTLLMSGEATTPRAQEFLRTPGVRGLLPKPFTIDRLIDRVAPLIGA
jgi:CheY-like chemotaxis protein